MRVPVVHGVIDRRILVNYRVDPTVVAGLLPPPFRPKLVGDFGIVGICLIRLVGIRPWFLPSSLGIASENAAHRIAVEWDEGGNRGQGVYVARRDTSSQINALVGGRIFPGVHHHARFDVREGREHYHVAMRSDDGTANVSVSAAQASALPRTSVFESLAAASAFFEAGSLGYSPAARPGRFDGLELRTVGWHATPLDATRVTSSFFENRELFPPGSTAFDSALLMQNLAHSWHARPTLSGAPGALVTLPAIN